MVLSHNEIELIPFNYELSKEQFLLVSSQQFIDFKTTTKPVKLVKTVKVIPDLISGHFPFVRTGWPDQSANEIAFFKGLLLKSHLLPARYLAFD